MNNVRDIIDQISVGNKVDARDSLQSVLHQKCSDAIAQIKTPVAQSMFNPKADTNEEA